MSGLKYLELNRFSRFYVYWIQTDRQTSIIYFNKIKETFSQQNDSYHQGIEGFRKLKLIYLLLFTNEKTTQNVEEYLQK